MDRHSMLSSMTPDQCDEDEEEMYGTSINCRIQGSNIIINIIL